MGIRNAAVPAAHFGSGVGMILLMLGALLNFKGLFLIGVIAFAAVVFFQLVNLPVEFGRQPSGQAGNWCNWESCRKKKCIM